MNQGLPLAQQILLQHGEFLPFASALRPNGEIICLGAYDGRDFRPLFGAEAELIRSLKDALIAGVRRKEYIATALFYDAGFTVGQETERTDAIAVSLNHSELYSVLVLLPYTIEGGSVMLGTPRAQAGEADIFRAN